MVVTSSLKRTESMICSLRGKEDVLDTRIYTPKREDRLLPGVIVVYPAIIKPSAISTAIIVSGGIIDTVPDGFSFVEVQRGTANIDIGTIGNQLTIGAYDFGRIEFGIVTSQVLGFLVCFEIPVVVPAEHDGRFLVGCGVDTD